MTTPLDLICPSNVGDEAFTLRVTSHRQGQPIATFETVVIEIDYTGAGAVGPVLPIEVIVSTLADRRAFERVVYRSTPPAQAIVRPTTAGRWLVTVREVAHDRAWGAVELDVIGSRG